MEDTVACLLPDAVPFQLSTPSLARDVLPMCASVRLRATQPSARSSISPYAELREFVGTLKTPLLELLLPLPDFVDTDLK